MILLVASAFCSLLGLSLAYGAWRKRPGPCYCEGLHKGDVKTRLVVYDHIQELRGSLNHYAHLARSWRDSYVNERFEAHAAAARLRTDLQRVSGELAESVRREEQAVDLLDVARDMWHNETERLQERHRAELTEIAQRNADDYTNRTATFSNTKWIQQGRCNHA